MREREEKRNEVTKKKGIESRFTFFFPFSKERERERTRARAQRDDDIVERKKKRGDDDEEEEEERDAPPPPPPILLPKKPFLKLLSREREEKEGFRYSNLEDRNGIHFGET